MRLKNEKAHTNKKDERQTYTNCKQQLINRKWMTDKISPQPIIINGEGKCQKLFPNYIN